MKYKKQAKLTDAVKVSGYCWGEWTRRRNRGVFRGFKSYSLS